MSQTGAKRSSQGWEATHDGQTVYGPVTLQDLVQAATEGRVVSTTRLRHPEVTQGAWVEAIRVRAIAAILNPTPQPRPTTSPPPQTNSPPPQTAVGAEMPGRVAPSMPVSVQSSSPVASAVPSTAATKTVARRKSNGDWIDLGGHSIEWIIRIFDFRFRYFATPWLIRIWWAILVVTTLVSALVSLASRLLRQMGVEVGSGGSTAGFAPTPWYASAFGWLQNEVLLTIVGVFTALIGSRVLFEIMIVVFRIAEDIAGARKDLEARFEEKS